MRKLTPYESTQLAKHGLSHLTLEEIGDQPIEYLTGSVDFCGLQFQVSPKVLIPRPETEKLVEMAFGFCQKFHQNHPSQEIKIIDVCCGSGAIGLSLAHQLTPQNIPFSLILSDISEAALEIASLNLSQLFPDSPPNIQLIESDLLSNPQLESQRYDLILSNPPYIPSARIPKLENSVKNFEPHLALDGGSDGLDLIKKLLQQSEKLLTKNGQLMVEIDHTHTLETLEPITKNFEIELIEDFLEKNRFMIAQLSP